MDRIAIELGIEVVDLSEKRISAYDYEHRNRDDDFEPLMRHVLTFEQAIFATPVYWYAVSPEQHTGKAISVQHVPEDALRAQHGAASDPLQKSFAALMLYYARGDVIDMNDTLRVLPVPHLKSVREYLPDRWSDLEAIFNARGCSVARGCWCMAYRVSGSREPAPGRTRAEANRAGLKALVKTGNPPGLIGYRGEVPVGWVSIGPREEYAKLKRSPVMKAVDEQPVWSIICFVVPTEYRGQGVAQALLEGAVAYAKKRGATLVEAYPVDKPGRSNDEDMWFGAKAMYDKAGFKEVARRKLRRPVVRIALA